MIFLLFYALPLLHGMPSTLLTQVQTFHDTYVAQFQHTKSSAHHTHLWAKDKRVREGGVCFTLPAAAYRSDYPAGPLLNYPSTT